MSPPFYPVDFIDAKGRQSGVSDNLRLKALG